MTAAARFSLPADPTAVREARRRLDALDGIPPRVIADAQLVMSELVTNAVLHAALEADDRIDVSLSIGSEHLIIEVADHGTFSRATHTTPRRPGGFGLRILDSVCDHWQAADGRVRAQIALRA